MWLDLKGKEYNKIEDFEGAHGFVYRIEHKETGKFYIGKKQLISKVNKKLGKKELANLEIKRGRKQTKKLVISETDWINYWGSSKNLKADIKKEGLDKFKRVIIQLAYNSKQLTYFETMYQISEKVLMREDSWNDSILGKFHRKDFEKY